MATQKPRFIAFAAFTLVGLPLATVRAQTPPEVPQADAPAATPPADTEPEPAPAPAPAPTTSEPDGVRAPAAAPVGTPVEYISLNPVSSCRPWV